MYSFLSGDSFTVCYATILAEADAINSFVMTLLILTYHHFFEDWHVNRCKHLLSTD